MKNKKLLSICILGIMLVPGVNVQAISNELNTNITIGDLYEKTVTRSIERTSLARNYREFMIDEQAEAMEASDKEKEIIETLIPKTNSNYEVTLAYDDGNYRYIDSADNFDEAVEIAKESSEASLVKSSSKSIIPAVIDSTGTVVYATESVGRAWKRYADGFTTDKDKDGKEIDRDMVLYLYSNPNLNLESECAYFSDGTISELPLLEQRGDSAKCYVSGKIGWTNTNINRDIRGCGHNNRDIVIQPINQVINPSYYIVKDGMLYRWVSISMSTPKGNDGSGYEKIIGLPPSYLTPGKRYFSYDGNYFYDAKDGTAATLSILTSDLQNGNYNHAVNKDNPYYAYFRYLPFRSKTNYTGKELDSFINAKTKSNSKLRGLGEKFIEVQNNYGINALLALSISINESAWGMSPISQSKNNLFGLNATDINPGDNADYFDCPGDSVEYFAKNYMSRGYADTADWRNYGGFLGNKALGANVKYASDPYWGETASALAFQIDRWLSKEDLSALKDYDNYQLIRYSSSNYVSSFYGNLLYNINSNVNPGTGYFIGGIEALSATDQIDIKGTHCYEIFPSRTTPTNAGGNNNKFSGNYDWNIRGYVPSRNVEFINKARKNWANEDINKDGIIDMIDLSIEASYYNENTIDFNIDLDINRDRIIDIYDIVRLSSKLNH